MAVRSRALDRVGNRLGNRLGNHIAVELPASASNRQHRELGAFARYCIHRVERELGVHEWRVHIAHAFGGYASRIEVRDHGALVAEQGGTGHDGALAIWEAMCLLEQRLRERR
jgi:hypothetical protein